MEKIELKISNPTIEINNDPVPELKTHACDVAKSFGIEYNESQPGLYIVKGCLVSAGSKAGINSKKDIFLAEETWKARKSPLLKPINWQHIESEVLGSIYKISAKDLSGNDLCIDHDETPETDFDIFIEAVIYSSINPERVEEIKRRLPEDLFFSMEAYFKSYDYGIFDGQGVTEVLPRTDHNRHLDYSLINYGGAGTMPNGKGVGRALRDISFAGCGFVDSPANNRSVIEVFAETTLEEKHEPSEIMAAASGNGSEVEKKEIKMEKLEEIVKPADPEILSKLDLMVNQLSQFKTKLQTKFENTSASFGETIESIGDGILAYIDSLKKDHETAIATLNQSLAASSSSLAEKESVIAKLSETIDLLKAGSRASEIKELFSKQVDDTVMASFISKASKLSDESYNEWLAEKKMIFSVIKTKASIELGSQPDLSKIKSEVVTKSRVELLSEEISRSMSQNLQGVKK